MTDNPTEQPAEDPTVPAEGVEQETGEDAEPLPTPEQPAEDDES
jgi:hypothetical protein